MELSYVFPLYHNSDNGNNNFLSHRQMHSPDPDTYFYKNAH